jgi:2-polyprenyl-3-methyl-5-hydroxy-6-metoxy-1,4-benzoquinol methylase
VCGCARAKLYKSRSDRRPLEPADVAITDSRYGLTLTLWQCEECGFIQAATDELSQLNDLYERLQDPGYERTQEPRRHQMRRLLRRVLRLHPEARTLLDIGAGAGALTRQARDLGLDAVGVEPSVSLVGSAARINGVTLLQGRFPHHSLDQRKFDIITIVDVIEHVSRPVRMLQQAADALAPEGVLVVITPDLGSLAARFLKQRWWHFRIAHVGYFNRATLLAAADRAGLRAVQVRRPTFYFPIEYVAVRLQRYVPLGILDRLVRKSQTAFWLYRRVIPINTHDSLAVFLRRRELTRADGHA